MAGDNSFKPDDIVKMSGIYSVVDEDGHGTFSRCRLSARGSRYHRLDILERPDYGALASTFDKIARCFHFRAH